MLQTLHITRNRFIEDKGRDLWSEVGNERPKIVKSGGKEDKKQITGICGNVSPSYPSGLPPMIKK